MLIRALQKLINFGTHDIVSKYLVIVKEVNRDSSHANSLSPLAWFNPCSITSLKGCRIVDGRTHISNFGLSNLGHSSQDRMLTFSNIFPFSMKYVAGARNCMTGIKLVEKSYDVISLYQFDNLSNYLKICTAKTFIAESTVQHKIALGCRGFECMIMLVVC